ncbi:enterobactin transporter EntS [Williamsia sp.]|uniref:enterobactin transporter EntS n=1 Tax=Williamsia sp. TaxID=1872085 RepID=UPI002F950723
MTEDKTTATGSRVFLDLRPLRDSVNFRRIFIARTISLLGIGMLTVSVPIQVYDLSDSTFLVGLVAAVEGIATIGGMLAGGILADRYDRRTLILFSRTMAGLTFAGLGVNAILDSPSVTAIIILAVINGAFGSISVAALLAVIPSLIPSDQMVGVGAINALTVRLGAVLSPILAGLIIAAWSVSWNYWITTIGTVITILILSGLPSLPVPVHEPSDKDAAADRDSTPINETALQFLRRDRLVGGVIAIGVIAMIGSGLVALIPGFVDEVFDGDSRTTGILFAAGAVGAVIASFTSGWMAHLRRPGVVLMSALAIGFVLQGAVGLTTTVLLAVPLLIAFGAATTIQEVLRYNLIQINTPAPLLGRVNSLWAAQEVAGLSIGALLAGAVGSFMAASTAVTVYSGILFVIALIGAAVLGRLRTYSPPKSSVLR